MNAQSSSPPDTVREARDLDAERAVLGAALINPDLIPTVDLTPEEFYRKGHQHLWSAIQALVTAGTVVDPLTLIAALARRDWLDEVGGRVYVAGLVDGVPHSTNIDAYARIVREKATLRALTSEVAALKARLELEEDDPATLIAEAESAIAAIQNHTQAVTTLDVTGQFMAWQTAVEIAETGPRIGLGLPAIDRVLEGISPGEVCGVMARPGLGKTLAMCHIATGLAGLGHACFSLEMPAPQIVERLARMVYRTNKYSLRRYLCAGTLDIGPYVAAFSDLLLDASPGLSVAQIAARVRRAQAQRRVVVVSIDHLGLVGGDERLTTYDRVSKQARELKELAKRCNVAVLLIIQANRDAGGDGSRELHLGSARDSGVIEEACDYLITLRRLDRSGTLTVAEREKYKDVIFARVLKHRHGVPMIDEVAYRIDPTSLALLEAPDLQPDDNDLARIARVGGGKRH